MIDPTKVHQIHWNAQSKQEFWLFCIAVAGKTAKSIAPKIDKFCYSYPESHFLPFDTIAEMCKKNVLRDRLESVKLGKYNTLVTGFTQSLHIDIDTATVEELEAIQGVGNKTARFFILYTRKVNNVAVIDTHIKKWLELKGYTVSNDYLVNEQNFLSEVAKRNTNVWELDIKIWNAFNSKDLILANTL